MKKIDHLNYFRSAPEAKAKNLNVTGNERVHDPKQESTMKKFFALLETPQNILGSRLPGQGGKFFKAY